MGERHIHIVFDANNRIVGVFEDTRTAKAVAFDESGHIETFETNRLYEHQSCD